MHRKAVSHLKRVDPILARVIERVGACRFEARTDGTHFDAVARSIVYQQLSGSAAHTIYSRMVALHGGEPPTPAQLLATADEALRGVGLSRQKIAYLKDLAARAASGEVPIETLHELSDADVIDALTRVKGVGRWTAQMFLMFRLGRENVLPDLDLGIRKGIQRAYRMRALPSPARIEKLGRAWSPYCSIASWYLWRLLDVDGVAGTPAAKRQSGAPRQGAKRNGRVSKRSAR